MLQAALSVVLALALSMPAAALASVFGAGSVQSAYAADTQTAAEQAAASRPQAQAQPQAQSEDDNAGGSGAAGTTDPEPDPTPEPVVNVAVPYVGGKDISTAKSAIEAAGLKYQIEGATSADAVVVSQRPATGMVAAGTVVVLTCEAPEVSTVNRLTIGYVDPGTDAYITHPVAENGQRPTIKTKGGKIQLLATTRWTNGNEDYASVLGVPVTWTSDDPDIATVDATSGIVTARSDGMATIRCRVDKYGTAESTIELRVAGQDGPYVVEVSVANEEGVSYGNQSIIITEFDGTTAVQLTARVLYSDGTIKSTAEGDEIENLTWSVSSSEVLTINETTGRMKPKADGTAEAIATVSGGLDGDVTGIAYVVVDTGQIERGYNPQSSFTVSVVYQSDESTEAAHKEYDVSSLSALGLSRAAYTQTKADGNWQTLVAEGVYLRTILSDVGVDTSKIVSFRFKTGDDWVSSPTLSYSYVFERAGYYFPNFDAGHLEAEKRYAEPMVAVRSKAVTNSVTEDYSTMDEGARFRFCLGSSTYTDVTANKSVMYVNTLIVVMEGAPPHSPDPDERGGTVGHEDDGPPGTTDTGEDLIETNGDTPDGTAVNETVLAFTNTAELPSQAQDRDAKVESDGASTSTSAQDTDADAEEKNSTRWQVFEMLSNDETVIDPIDFYNPLEPFALPAALAVAIAGGAYANVRFRRELAA